MGIFLLFFMVYVCTASFLYPEVFYHQEAIFHADTESGSYMMKDESNYLIFLKKSFPWVEISRADRLRHISSMILQSFIYCTVRGLLPVGEDDAIILVLALLGAANVLVAHSALRHMLKNEEEAFFFSLFYGFAFSNLIFFSIPENYVATDLFVALYFYCLVRAQERFSLKEALIFSVIIGVAALSNPPLISLLLPTWYFIHRVSSGNRPLLLDLVCALGGFFIFYGLSSFFVLDFWTKGFKFLGIWTSAGNFADFRYMAHVFLSFFFFGIISPMRALHEPGMGDWRGYITALGIPLLLMYLGTLCLLISHFMRRSNSLAQAILVWLITLLLFYTCFDPREAMLFSSQCVLPLTMLFASAHAGRHSSLPVVARVLFLLLMILNNLLVLRHGVTWI